jgi:hypothetical protein
LPPNAEQSWHFSARFLTYRPSCAKTKVAFLLCLWEKNGEVRNYGELAALCVDFGLVGSC